MKYEKIEKFFLEIIIDDVLLPIKTSRNISKRDQQDFLKRHEDKIEYLVKKTLEERNSSEIQNFCSLIKENIRSNKENPSFNSQPINLLFKSLNKKIIEKANFYANNQPSDEKVEGNSHFFQARIKSTLSR